MSHETNFTASGSDDAAAAALNQSALDYHQYPRPGKIAVLPIKGMTNQRDLAPAYSPGVAAPCLAIQADPATAALYTLGFKQARRRWRPPVSRRLDRLARSTALPEVV